ncbi:MAG: DUF2809 domain-containing protein [Oscillospiraceae bacterium]|nr:DUF2809 domain-containing protein [Oscillospiraceae bacterium]
MKKTVIRRIVYAAALVCLCVLALAVRRANGAAPSFFNTYFPDTAWTMAVYCGLGLLVDRSPLFNLIASLLISYAVEISQLFHPAFLEALRATRIGGLILGYGFLWSDLLCYTVGALLCYGVHSLLLRRVDRTQ